MARPRTRPAPPRISAPDVPPDPAPAALTRSADIVDARVQLGPGDADGAYARISESVVAAASVDRLDLTGAILSDVRFDDPAAASLAAREGSWQSVRVSGGRIGTLDLTRARCDGVELRGVRIDYLSAPAATVRDVLVVDCVIGTLDLPGAALERVRFENTTVDEVDTREMRVADLDLRGLEALAFTDVRALREATISLRQAEAHAGALAAALGIDVRSSDATSRERP